MIILTIKKKWFDMIKSGEKKEEYREIKPYYDSRLPKEFGMFREGNKLVIGSTWGYLRNYILKQQIIFRNGYNQNSPCINAICSLDIGTGKEEWGAVPGKIYYVLKIHEIVK